MIDQLTILAPGLMGGSAARAARARGAARRIVIWARRRETLESIAAEPWCDSVARTPEEAVNGSDLVIIASPVDAIVPLVRRIAAHLPAGSIVTDVGSVKGAIARPAHAALPSGVHFVGAHPMAGSEKTGWENGSATLFERRTCFVVPLPETEPRAIDRTARFWTDLGANVAFATPEEHDRIVANISHLPQVVASSLCSLLAGKDPAWRSHAGGGLRDTTRIAGGDSALWRAILENNCGEVRRALREFQAELTSLDTALERGDWAEVEARLARAKAYREGFGG